VIQLLFNSEKISLNLRLLQIQLALVVADVAEVDDQVGCHQQHVECIKVRDDIVVVEHFVGDSHGVADDKQNKKKRAFADDYFGAQAFHDGNWPAACKAEKHENFEN